MDDHGTGSGTRGNLSGVPLFPLPNVVLFPRAILPLHIFEERYKTMTADALAGDKQIAMALLKPGWEKNYYGKPEIDTVVCVGTIVSHERLGDGKYNFLLQGHTRATIQHEVGSCEPYRRANLQPMACSQVMEIDLTNERLQLTSMLSEDAFSEMALSRQFLQMLSSPVPTADVVDLIAFNMLDRVYLKQKLLAEPDPRKRAQRVICALDALRPVMEISRCNSAPFAHKN